MCLTCLSEELHVEEGDSVLMGQLLAKIDPEAYVSTVERGEASRNLGLGREVAPPEDDPRPGRCGLKREGDLGTGV